MSESVNGVQSSFGRFLRVLQSLPGMIKTVPIIIILSLLVFVLPIWNIQGFFNNLSHGFANAHAPAQTVSEVKNIVVGGLQDMKTFDTVSSVDKATVVVHRDNKTLWNWVTLGSTDLAYEGVARIQGGLNLNQISVQRFNNGTIRVVLPSAEITGIYLDVEKSKIIMEGRTNFLNPGADPSLQSKAQRDALAEIRATACANGILDRENENAEQFVRQILTDAGVEQVEIQVQPMTNNICG